MKAEQRSSGWHALRFIPDPSKVHVDCSECGKAMYLPACKADKYKSCSKDCSRVKRLSQRQSRRRECQICGNEFFPRLAQIKIGAGKFCSRPCNNVVSVKSLHVPEVQQKAKTRFRQLRADGVIVNKKGPEHKQWTGGPAMWTVRRQESGKALKSLRAYRKNNPHKIKEFTQRRSSRKIGRLPKGTILQIGNSQRWKCAICRHGIKRAHHVDHIKPLARGGEHKPSNIQLLCKSCNLHKSSRDPITHMQSLGRLL